MNEPLSSPSPTAHCVAPPEPENPQGDSDRTAEICRRHRQKWLRTHWLLQTTLTLNSVCA